MWLLFLEGGWVSCVCVCAGAVVYHVHRLSDCCAIFWANIFSFGWSGVLCCAVLLSWVVGLEVVLWTGKGREGEVSL